MDTIKETNGLEHSFVWSLICNKGSKFYTEGDFCLVSAPLYPVRSEFGVCYLILVPYSASMFHVI